MGNMASVGASVVCLWYQWFLVGVTWQVLNGLSRCDTFSGRGMALVDVCVA